MPPVKIVILGGTTEAAELARLLATDDRFAPTVSLAGVTAAPAPSPIPRRIGGFGGPDGLAAYLDRHHVDCLVDATHPFAARITAHAHAAVRTTGTPFLRLRRPEWTPLPGDDWREAADMWAAADQLGPVSRRVLLTVGRHDLASFCATPHHLYVARSIDPQAGLPPGAEPILARGPYAYADELELLRTRRIDMLVTKNSGGDATRAKLDAARTLGLAVIMVARPSEPDMPLASDAPAALGWLLHVAERGA